MPAPRFSPAERRITAELMRADHYRGLSLQEIRKKYKVSYGLAQNMLREVETVMRAKGNPGARYNYEN